MVYSATARAINCSVVIDFDFVVGRAASKTNRTDFVLTGLNDTIAWTGVFSSAEPLWPTETQVPVAIDLHVDGLRPRARGVEHDAADSLRGIPVQLQPLAAGLALRGAPLRVHAAVVHSRQADTAAANWTPRALPAEQCCPA